MANLRNQLSGTMAEISAIERLRLLPEVFTGTDVTILFGWTSQTASTYLANWRKAKLIQSLGGRSDVHMNLVCNPTPNPEVALRRVFPQAIRIGVDILRQAGWTTQVIRDPEVAIPVGTFYTVNGFTLTTRNDSWFRKILPGVQDGQVGLRFLEPAWALADMIARAMDGRVCDPWLLAPDDIDIEAAAADPQMKAARQAFKLRKHVLTVVGYESIYDTTGMGALTAHDNPRDREMG